MQGVREVGGFGGFAVCYAGLLCLCLSAKSATKMQIPSSGLFIQVSEGGVVREGDKAVFGSHLHPSRV